jgi:hypothetical protein
MSEAEVPRRPVAKRFAKGEWETLHEIILKGDGGKFREILHDRNVSTNMLKADMWGQITYLFCEVCTGYILFSMLGIRNRIQIRIDFYRFCTRLRILLKVSYTTGSGSTTLLFCPLGSLKCQYTRVVDPDPQRSAFGYLAGFRIRIDLMRIRIRIRIQHFF